MLAGRESRMTAAQAHGSPSGRGGVAGMGTSRYEPGYQARMERKLSKKSYQSYADTMKSAINRSIAQNVLPNWRSHHSLRGWYSMNYPAIRQNPLLQKRPKPLHYDDIKFSNMDRPMSAPQRPIIQPLRSASETAKLPAQPSKLSLLASSASRSETFYVENRVLRSGGALSGNLSHPAMTTAASGFLQSSQRAGKVSAATMATMSYEQKADILEKMNEQSTHYSTIHPQHAVLGIKQQGFDRRKVKQLGDIEFDIPRESEEHKHHKWMNKQVLTEEALRGILSPAVDRLSLQNHNWIRPCYLDKIGRLAPNLSVLSLRATQTTDDAIDAIFLYARGIQELDLSRCSALTPTALIYVADRSPRLTILNAAHNSEAVTDEVLARLQPLPFLSVLNISYCKQVTDAGLCALSRADFEEPNEIDTSANPTVPNVISVQPSLREIYLNGLPQITNTGLMKLVRDQHQVLESLEMAYLRQEELTDEVCKEIAHCDRLLRLDMSGCVNMRDEGLCYLSKGLGKQEKVCGLPRLMVLKLNGLVEMGDQPLMQAADTFTRVEVLELARCEKVTETSVEKVLKCMPALKLVDLNLVEVKGEWLDELRANPKFGVTIKRFTVQTVDPKDTGLRVPLPVKKKEKAKKKKKGGKKKKK